MTVYGYFAPAAAVLLMCLAFAIYNRKKVNDARYSVAAFLNIFAVELSAIFPFAIVDNAEIREMSVVIFPIALLLPFFVDLIPVKTDSVFKSPIRIFSLFGSLFVTCFMILIGEISIHGHFEDGTDGYLRFDVPYMILLCAYGVLFVIRYKKWKKQA